MSDGISTSLLEAMASGAFPIQSDTSCADEWVINGTNGFIVPWDDPVAISKCIQKALTDDVLVDSAREINTQISLKRLSPERVESSRKTFYST
jgi:glycosyltransferase involved in cell wall biosynthesis